MKPDRDRRDGAAGPSGADAAKAPPHGLGGIIHTYQKYDPVRLPSPTRPEPDVAGAAFDHMMSFGSLRRLSPEELANAVQLDPSQIAGLGPSLEALIAMLEERKRKILETYETSNVLAAAAKQVAVAAGRARPPSPLRKRFRHALRSEQLHDLEQLWYRAERTDPDFAAALLHVTERMGEKYQVDELDAKYDFTGRTPMDVPKALEVKDELEAIDRLLEQLREAMKHARIGVIDLEELRHFVEEADIAQLEALRDQVEDYVRELAARQGLEAGADGYALTPQAYRLMQGKLLDEIFSDLEAARSGRHEGEITGEGAVELPTTRPYEFGDSPANMDIPQTFLNALLREAGEGGGPRSHGPLRLHTDDIEVHPTKNHPQCATCLLMDMSGSMRYGGQYIDCKRMALALDGLIRREYPGDFLQCIEIYTFAKPRHISEVAGLLPRPVTLRDPWIRLKVDMAREDVSESIVPPHFTNIQHGLQLARRFLSARDTPNRQIVLITDGLPTAHFEGSELFLLYPPDPLTEHATMREALLCAREQITINIFLVPSWSQSSEDVQFAHRVAESTKGRVFFTGGHDLDRYVVWDYVHQRRHIIG